MCDAQIEEDDTLKDCIRQYPAVHSEHFAEDGATWMS